MPDPCCSLINTLYIGIIRQKLDFASKSFHKYPLKKNRHAAQRGNGKSHSMEFEEGSCKNAGRGKFHMGFDIWHSYRLGKLSDKHGT